MSSLITQKVLDYFECAKDQFEKMKYGQVLHLLKSNLLTTLEDALPVEWETADRTNLERSKGRDDSSLWWMDISEGRIEL